MEPIVCKNEFNLELRKYYSGLDKNTKKLEWSSERISNIIKLLEDFNLAKTRGRRPTNREYHHSKKYDLMHVGDQKVLILRRKEISDPIVQIICTEEYYDRILDAHIATGHGRRDKIVHSLKDKYLVPIFAIKTFLSLCKTCLSKKSFPKKGIVVKPLISDDFNRRGQMDLVDFQTSPDEEYKWLLQYQDHLTKFCFLRPLKSKQAKEVAIEILKIFLEVGCPCILQSDNGREFTASVIKEIVSLWPACKIVNGRPRYPQSQGSIERSNQDIKNMIRAWMADNRTTNWSIGCYFVQFQKNSSFHSTIARTPYKALFGEDPKLGLSSTYLSKNIISKLELEEDIEIVLQDIDNYEKQNPEKNQDAQQEETVPTVERAKSDTTMNVHDNSPIVTDIKILKTHTCIKCRKIFHTTCGGQSEEDDDYGSQLLCNLCVNEHNIVQVRKQSHINLKRAADKMITTSSKKFKDISIGECVLVEVPKVDRGPLDNKNVVGRVLEKRNELYQVGTAFGIIKDWMPRNAILASSGAALPDFIPEVTVPLRGIASMSSSFGGQGMKQCNCKKIKNGQCVSNKCKCKKNNVLCNSRCHSSLTCNNK